ncbi:hypothetical protein QUB80_23350 [Chlorogloeopsis sp. ULAP01]|nr:hypothetical protein [Chlorogloeopsis sp. ULAP01]MDM9383625.1 hypothetical protein [Chlorogloeopsis sp. ULAP01]
MKNFTMNGSKYTVHCVSGAMLTVLVWYFWKTGMSKSAMNINL